MRVLIVLFVALFGVVMGDFVPKTWICNLDLPPAQRWPYQEMAAEYNESIHEAVALINQFIPSLLVPEVEELAKLALPYLGDDFAEEIRIGASIMGIDLGVATLLNIIYEVEAGCTSIIASDPQNRILHTRNLDFNLAKVLRKLAVKVEFQRNGQTVYYGTTYVGYFGLLTGMKPGAFSVSVDQRSDGNVIENLLEALFIDGTWAASFLIRDTLENVNSFEDAVERLSNTSVVAPVYIIVGGLQGDEGAVITRGRETAVDVWRLDSLNGRWFEVETNYDHWLPTPQDDQRRETANAGMLNIGRPNISLDTMYTVLSTPQVLNHGTTYSTLMSASTGNYTVIVRQP